MPQSFSVFHIFQSFFRNASPSVDMSSRSGTRLWIYFCSPGECCVSECASGRGVGVHRGVCLGVAYPKVFPWAWCGPWSASRAWWRAVEVPITASTGFQSPRFTVPSFTATFNATRRVFVLNVYKLSSPRGILTFRRVTLIFRGTLPCILPSILLIRTQRGTLANTPTHNRYKCLERANLRRAVTPLEDQHCSLGAKQHT